MSEEIRIREIDVVLSKVSIAPGDCLVVSLPQTARCNNECRKRIEDAFEESFGVPALLLTDGMKLEAVLTVSPECLDQARQNRESAMEETRKKFRATQLEP